MKIDLHTHCLPVSLCSRCDAAQLTAAFHEKGIDAIVLTNHCYPRHCDVLSADPKEQARLYVENYHLCKAMGEVVGLKIFFGVELKLVSEPNAPEFLLYGISEQDFIDFHPLYNCTQKQLFDFCNDRDILMVQAHPLRIEQGYAPADMRYMHGLEVYNRTPIFDVKFEESVKLAEEYGMLKTAGSDFHVREQAGLSGMILPDDITDQFMLRDYLRSEKTVLFNEYGIFYETE